MAARTPFSSRIKMGHQVGALWALSLLLIISPYLCQAYTNSEKESIQYSINMESDDSGSGDKTFTISLVASDALFDNKSAHMVGDSICVKDNGTGFVLLNNEMDYLNCNSSNPLHLFNSNNASYTLNNPGTFYIISLKADLCNDGVKMMIKVQERESTPSPESSHQISLDSSSGAQSSVLSFYNLMAAVVIGLIICTFIDGPILPSLA